MRLRKLVAASVAVVLAASLTVMPVSAHHGHHRQPQAADTSCPVCTVDDCTEKGRHTHDGKEYCGYDHADGYCDHSCEAAQSRGRRHHCR